MKATKRTSRQPTLADKHDVALARLSAARATIKQLRAQTLDRHRVRDVVTTAALETLEAHGLIEPAPMLAEALAARVDAALEHP